jgi:hypothetical protein
MYVVVCIIMFFFMANERRGSFKKTDGKYEEISIDFMQYVYVLMAMCALAALNSSGYGEVVIAQSRDDIITEPDPSVTDAMKWRFYNKLMNSGLMALVWSSILVNLFVAIWNAKIAAVEKQRSAE